MASLSEMIAYADWKRSQQLPDPTVISGLNSIAGAIRGAGTEKRQNRMLQIMGEKPGFSWETDDTGKMRYKYDPNAGKKKSQVFNVGGGKLVKYNPDDESTNIVFDANEEDASVESAETPEKKYNPNDVDSWEKVPVLSRIISALTPSATPEEQQLGGLRFGGVFNPPKVKKGVPAAKVDEIIETPSNEDNSEVVYFKNKQTGGKEPFRKVNGKWVKVNQ